MAPAVRKLLMIGLDNMLLRNASLAPLRKRNNKPVTNEIYSRKVDIY